MAKALYGHLVTGDATLVWENDRLRARIVELEAQVEQLSLELAASADLTRLALDQHLSTDDLRPALA
jgi:hypothetical protein